MKPLVLPDADISISFVRATGPGGQNVNKLSTAAQLRFDVAGTTVLDEASKARLRVLAGRRVTDEDELLIIARNHRTQEGNRREALARLQALVEAARIAPVPRRATRPTRASKQRRLQTKAHDQRVKQMRGKVRDRD
ncbi:MAG: alternative ribosome rescue aminoacyl-tRNA hydrolase ArfB [Proteobacteria bacterium]|nr:alternative ribosome rescue aminoacyl-tRNA hydrolase ArfB [Pseudomonadota bacterium]